MLQQRALRAAIVWLIQSLFQCSARVGSGYSDKDDNSPVFFVYFFRWQKSLFFHHPCFIYLHILVHEYLFFQNPRRLFSDRRLKTAKIVNLSFDRHEVCWQLDHMQIQNGRCGVTGTRHRYDYSLKHAQWYPRWHHAVSTVTASGRLSLPFMWSTSGNIMPPSEGALWKRPHDEYLVHLLRDTNHTWPWSFSRGGLFARWELGRNCSFLDVYFTS